VGYAAFAVSAGVAVMYLMKAKREERKVTGGVVALFPSTRVLDDLVYKSIIWGFPFLTAGIITGAAWANYAWGTYWSWDPKETWSLIVWLVYAAFLHARVTRGWHGRRAAILSGGDPVDRRVPGHDLLLSGGEPGSFRAAFLWRRVKAGRKVSRKRP
jgi:cytochrome c-type biogenesis protein CcsB